MIATVALTILTLVGPRTGGSSEGQEVFRDAVKDGLWRVRGSVGGREGLYALALGSSRTYVRAPLPDVENGAEVAVQVGGQTLAPVPVWTAELPAAPKEYAGVIGIGALRGRMIGFDLVRGEITIWLAATDGSVASGSVADEWALRGEGEGKTVSLPLEALPEGYRALRMKVGASERRLLLSSNTPTFELLRSVGTGATFWKTGENAAIEAHTGATSRSDSGVIGPLEIGGQKGPPIWGELVEATELAEYPGDPEGLLPIQSLPYERVVVDLVRDRVVAEPLSHGALTDRWLTGMLGFPLRIQGEQIRVAASEWPGYRHAVNYAGDQVLEIGPLPALDVIRATREFGSESLFVGATLSRLRRAPYVILLQQHKAKYRLTVNPAPGR